MLGGGPTGERLTQPLVDSGVVHVNPSSAIAAAQEESGNASKKTSPPNTTGPIKSQPPAFTAGREIGPSKKFYGKKIMLVGACVALVAVMIVLFLHHRSRQARLPSYEVAVLEESWVDQSRNRDIPVKIYFPKAGAGPFPAIVFSHGLGGTRESRSRLGSRWAASGYVSIHVQHNGTDANSMKPSNQAARNLLQQRRKGLSRSLDVSFVISRLQEMNGSDQRFKGRIDLNRIGMAGVGLGAVTALAAAGQVFYTAQGEEKTFRDDRIKACVLVNPNVPQRQKAHEDSAFAKITIPILHIISAREHGTGPDSRMADRRAPYEHISGADQYLITLWEHDEANFFDGNSTAAHRQEGPVDEIMRVGTTKFWDAYLKEDSASKAWLTDGGLASILGANGKLERNLIK